MTPEKAAVLGVTALIAVLLAIALLSSQPRAGTLPRTGHRNEPRSPRTDPPEDWKSHGDLIEVVRRGGARTKARPPRAEKSERTGSKRRAAPSRRKGTKGAGRAASKGRARSDDTWVIRDGDTFEGIGIAHYGRKGLGLKIARANPGIDPRRLRDGMVVELPDLNSRRAPARRSGRAAPAAKSAAVHVVRSGEVLTGISLEHYGTTRHWRRIFEANRDQLKNPDRLRAGMGLRLPRIPGSVTMARR